MMKAKIMGAESKNMGRCKMLDSLKRGSGRYEAVINTPETKQLVVERGLGDCRADRAQMWEHDCASFTLGRPSASLGERLTLTEH
jgi:hypothetical protein